MGHAERRVLIVAGERSGDAHAARLVAELRALGDCRVRGVTGPALEHEGAERIVAMDELAVLGFSAVLARLPRLFAAYRRILDEARRWKPDVCVLVDAPGFNLRLGPQLKRLGLRVVYYIAPQVWAWHPERARAMAAWVDELAVVFPFEEPLFHDAGVRATFVGHPLLDALAPEVDEATLRAELELEPGARIVGLLPGSRAQELQHHTPALLGAAAMLGRERSDFAFVVAHPSVPGLADGRVDDAHAAHGARVRVVRGRTHAVQAFAVAAAVASGTASLETALFGTPLAIVFRTGRLNFAIARRLVTLKRIGLPNIVAGEDVAPELIQGACQPERIAAALAPWLDDPRAHAEQVAKLARVRAALGEPGAARRAAARVWEHLA
ncbi:MAG TPA: lipid-A-disaccharide synthase [Candidatus Saccharimonadaceae bacterium]|jgi:lipid-A-disaccharide synthase|nr:lipid-A-disaccharide synthase [Candidatus Saccharimonadaceae bacterium]